MELLKSGAWIIGHTVAKLTAADIIAWQRRTWYRNRLIKQCQDLTFSIADHKKLNCLARYFSPCLSGFLLQSDRLKQVKIIETARWDLVKGDR